MILDYKKEGLSQVAFVAQLITYAAHKRSQTPALFPLEPPSGKVSEHLASLALSTLKETRGHIYTTNDLPLNIIIKGDEVDVTGYDDLYGEGSARSALRQARRNERFINNHVSAAFKM